jgi:hypothetical protein
MGHERNDLDVVGEEKSDIVRYHHKWYGKFTRNWLFAQVHSHGMLPYSGVSGKLGKKRNSAICLTYSPYAERSWGEMKPSKPSRLAAKGVLYC